MQIEEKKRRSTELVAQQNIEPKPSPEKKLRRNYELSENSKHIEKVVHDWENKEDLRLRINCTPVEFLCFMLKRLNLLANT